jgi:hypothetical protein
VRPLASGRVEGAGGNREVPPSAVHIKRAALGVANLEKEGGSRGKPGFPRATEPKVREAAAA